MAANGQLRTLAYECTTRQMSGRQPNPDSENILRASRSASPSARRLANLVWKAAVAASSPPRSRIGREGVPSPLVLCNDGTHSLRPAALAEHRHRPVGEARPLAFDRLPAQVHDVVHLPPARLQRCGPSSSPIGADVFPSASATPPIAVFTVTNGGAARPIDRTKVSPIPRHRAGGGLNAAR